jgi:hypothetical protein
MIGILTRFEADPYGQTLDHFYVITGRILRRKKTETIATGARQILYVALIIAAEGIDVNSDFLATMHPGELRFLEVRDYPYIVGLGHEHQGLPGLDSRTQLDRSLADDAVCGRVDFCVAQV